MCIRDRELAKQGKVQVYWYHDFLGQLVEEYTSISVAGTHGKTTTTGMISHVMAEVAPTGFLIGDGTGAVSYTHLTLQEVCPAMSLIQAAFYAKHHEAHHYYTIAQCMQEHDVCYETARTSMAVSYTHLYISFLSTFLTAVDHG